MGEVLWTASLRTTIGLVVPMLIVLGSAARMLGTAGRPGWQVALDVLALLGGLGLFAVNVRSRVEVGTDGIATRPWGKRYAWRAIVVVAPRRTPLGSTVALQLTDGVPATLTAYSLGTVRATSLAARIEAERASRSGT